MGKMNRKARTDVDGGLKGEGRGEVGGRRNEWTLAIFEVGDGCGGYLGCLMGLLFPVSFFFFSFYIFSFYCVYMIPHFQPFRDFFFFFGFFADLSIPSILFSPRRRDLEGYQATAGVPGGD